MNVWDRVLAVVFGALAVAIWVIGLGVSQAGWRPGSVPSWLWPFLQVLAVGAGVWIFVLLVAEARSRNRAFDAREHADEAHQSANPFDEDEFEGGDGR